MNVDRPKPRTFPISPARRAPPGVPRKPPEVPEVTVSNGSMEHDSLDLSAPPALPQVNPGNIAVNNGNLPQVNASGIAAGRRRQTGGLLGSCCGCFSSGSSG